VSSEKLKVMVLAGGPDRERAVSLKSGAAVAGALVEAGHTVLECDIGPDDLSALDRWSKWGGDVVFPVLHGAWGEGGPLQHILDERAIRYVGSTEQAAQLCMDKHQTKQVLAKHGLATPKFQLVVAGQEPTLGLPMVLKPICEGSSIDLMICHNQGQVSTASQQLQQRHRSYLAEQFIEGKELTVGVLGSRSSPRALPAIQILPATSFYDYHAKYDRGDTRYRVGVQEIDLPAQVVESASHLAVDAHRLLGCRHLSRVDFIIDRQHQPWLLEVNTMPGFTSHSLLPMAGGAVDLSLAQLVDRLVRLAYSDR